MDEPKGACTVCAAEAWFRCTVCLEPVCEEHVYHTRQGNAMCAFCWHDEVFP